MRLKKLFYTIIAPAVAACLPVAGALAQGMHFSQYYNAPMLLNPANTALMADNDYRVGANYRNQWASIPVPYRTMSAYADFQAMRNSELSNWLGVGVAFFNDKAGAGDLSLSRTEAFVAYHLQLGYKSMLSAGLSGAYVQRSVDFSKLTFDMQWDGFSFNGSLPNGEQGGIAKTSFMDVGAGLNYAYYPNDNVYLKIGFGLAHINQPRESFYSMINRMGMRPTGNIDLVLRANSTFIVNPSVYYTNQKTASELVYGSLFQFWTGGEGTQSTQLIIGAFHRWNEAVIGTFGYEWGGLRLMSSYDFTVSKLSPYNNGQGALEFAVRYQGFYGSGGSARHLYNCPRF